MIDIKKIREDLANTIQLISVRSNDYEVYLKAVFEADKSLRKLRTLNQLLESERNQKSKRVGEYVRENKTALANKLKESMLIIKKEIDNNNEKIKELEKIFRENSLLIPNIPHSSVTKGSDDKDNVEVRKWGKIKVKTNLPHWEIAEKLGLVDFSRATKLSGSRFLMYRDKGAAIVRALVNFMLDENTKRGYKEQLPPLIVNENVLVGTGQLPKFLNDQFKIDGRNQFLIPTAEVPLTNIYRDEILKESDLPIKMCAYTPCFRLEAGSAGKDTRGMIRLHQFNKVELVQIVKPEESYDALEKLTNDAESLLQLLEIPYRVVALCSGDLGFTAAKTYDIELWLPGQETYREVSSCSNCEDFQARRMNMRVSDKVNNRKFYPHTLNGSGLAIDRVFAAILENYYDAKTETLSIPRNLYKYMNGITEVKL